jgi:hypothetical protein
MPTSCASISDCILLNCDFPIVGGANDRIFLFNKSDLASVEYFEEDSVINPYLVTDLILNTACKLYKFEGQNQSVDLRAALVRQRYAAVYDHEVIFKIFDNSPAVKLQIERLGRGVVIAVVEKNFKSSTGKGSFEIYGLNSGLILTAAESNASDGDTQGAWNMTLVSSEFAKEPGLPLTFLYNNTDLPQTLDYLESLACC